MDYTAFQALISIWFRNDVDTFCHYLDTIKKEILPMDVLVVKDYEAMSRKGADIISALLTLNGKAVLGLATGSK